MPNRSAISLISSGRATAAVLTPTLSAPARSSRSTSSGDAHAAADGERDEHLLGGTSHHVVRRLAVAAARGDVEERQLVGALRVVGPGQLDRVTGVAQVDEVDALDDPTGVDVEAGDDADRDAHRTLMRGSTDELVDVAPGPVLAGLEAADDGVAVTAGVRRRVLAARRVAAADVPAGQAQPQVHPGPAERQALLAAVAVAGGSVSGSASR